MIPDLLYNYFALPAGIFGYRLISLFNEKAGRAFRLRKNLFTDLEKNLGRVSGKKTVLVHISSVGEYLQVRPVLRLLRQKAPETKLVLSYFSPSLEPMVQKGVEAEFATYLPFDRRSDMARFLDLLKPGLIIFSCYDLWPNLIALAKASGVKSILINANLAENSGKLNPLVSWWFKNLYQSLDLILAASAEDQQMIHGLGVAESKITVTGNTRFDETLTRIKAISEDDALIKKLSGFREKGRAGGGSLCLAIGSSWPEDEAIILPVLQKIWESKKDLKVIIAPHEPSPQHVQDLQKKLSELAAEPVLLSELESGSKAVSASGKAVIVDSVGKLYKLYQLADLAYVGGSFRKEVHNVMEPAGFNLPVLFGPKITNSLEALKLSERKGGFVVHNIEELFQRLNLFLDDKDARSAAGRQAGGLVLENQGASERTVNILTEVFPALFQPGAKTGK
jgi:3-deoxy-D-manno-octulosonic-acid transferase